MNIPMGILEENTETFFQAFLTGLCPQSHQSFAPIQTHSNKPRWYTHPHRNCISIQMHMGGIPVNIGRMRVQSLGFALLYEYQYYGDL